MFENLIVNDKVGYAQNLVSQVMKILVEKKSNTDSMKFIVQMKIGNIFDAVFSGKTSQGVQEQLEDLFNTASDRTKDLADSLEPLEKQLEELLDELNTTLRPRIEKPVRQRPLVAIGIATGIGVLLGVLLAGGRRS